MTTTITDPSQYTSADCFIGVNHDNISSMSIHPSESLLLAGPPRIDPNITTQGLFTQLFPLGMVLGFSVQVQVPNSPQQFVGSNRLGNMSNRPMYSWSTSRVLVADRDLARCLYTFIVQKLAADSQLLNDPRIIRPDVFSATVEPGRGTQWTNFESEVFQVPFGLYLIERSRDKRTRMMSYQGCYATGYGTATQAGQSQIQEQLSGWCDERVQVPLAASDLTSLQETFRQMVTSLANNDDPLLR